MKSMSPPSSNNWRCGFAFAAMLGLLASAASVVTHAANLVLTGSTTANCTYSSAGIDTAGTLSIVTTSNCILTPDSLAFASIPTAVVVNGLVNVTITRANPVGPSITGTVTSTNGCLIGNGGIAGFSGAQTSTTLSITAPAAVPASACVVSLAAGAGATLGTPSTFDLPVTATAPLPSDALAFSAASATVASSGSTIVNVTRTTSNYGVSATLGVSGGCTLSSYTAPFSQGSTAAVPITVTAPAGPATCVVTLTPGTNATAGSPSTYTLTVSAPVVVAPPPTTPGCTTAANTNFDIRNGGRPAILLGAGQSSAVKFYAPGDAKLAGTMSTAEYIGSTLPPDIQVNISQCPGDFTVVAEACGSYAPGLSSTTTYNVGSGPFWNCVVDSTKTWYLNVRFPSCSGTCGVYVDRY